MSYLSTIVTWSCSLASFLLMGWHLVVLGGIIRGALGVSLVVISAVVGSGLDDCILYCIGVLIPGTIESCEVSDSLCFLRNSN